MIDPLSFARVAFLGSILVGEPGTSCALGLQIPMIEASHICFGVPNPKPLVILE